MKEVKFKVFLQVNQIKKTELPEPLVEKIGLFWKLHAILENIQDTDRAELLEQLEQLDYEILGDIEEEYEDQLENNDRLEELLKSPTVKKAIKKKVVEKLRTDQTILQELVAIGRTSNIGKSELHDLGIKTVLGWKTKIGKFLLKRNSIWYYRYDIEVVD